MLPVAKKSSTFHGDELEVRIPDGVVVQGGTEVAAV